ncbi:8-amino-7-oxononanoate synthase [Veillonella sp.]|uniref:8-amino-7-oxononanoate synthase n=1 Tax=Veillonella sp. TaxID=1926307 RepID=UPI001EC6E876|nr:8-amino-7-oxononanoate synthase [Veillonella sp.]MBS5765345.1 8-amino-7-oxononanoate synthase [Veillonella sp.]MBS6309085.1 8-amino-7-oxononanoate synthase [Veillonella sp.]MDU5865706.1 8-amino-7-oxononanoate synthase [Veillonella sp.]
MYEYFKGQLDAKVQNHNLRTLKEYCPIDAVRVKRDDKEYLMMASNNYLGLTFDTRVIDGALKGTKQYGTGSGGSRLVSGTFPLFTELEKELAKFKNTEKALVFNTGYMANVGTISAIADKNTIIFSDALNHASIIDGCRLSRGSVKAYSHCDVDELKYLLKQVDCNARKLIVTDGVFSMDGDIAPLDKLYELSRDYNALLMVDDAHATGTIGNGHGTAAYFNLEKEIDIQLGTLSKSLGSVGGYVAANSTIIDYLVNTSRSFIFSTALSPADIGAALAALKVLETDASVLGRLQENVNYMTDQLISMGIDATNETPIFPILIGRNEDTLAVSDYLYENGIIGTAIRPPTVPIGESRIRLTVTAAHNREQIDYVCHTLHKAIQKIK